jgi:hypothetical protein
MVLVGSFLPGRRALSALRSQRLPHSCRSRCLTEPCLLTGGVLGDLVIVLATDFALAPASVFFLLLASATWFRPAGVLASRVEIVPLLGWRALGDHGRHGTRVCLGVNDVVILRRAGVLSATPGVAG